LEENNREGDIPVVK